MLSPVIVAFALIVLLAQAAPPIQTPAVPPTPATAPTDPATSAFAGDAGLMLVAIKPAAVADYELVITTLQAALAADQDPSRREATRGWRVYKAGSDAKGSALYVHLMLPAVPGFDYRPSLLVDSLVKELAPGLLSKYQDSFASPPSKLDLTELANMAIAPIVPVEPKKPGGRN